MNKNLYSMWVDELGLTHMIPLVILDEEEMKEERAENGRRNSKIIKKNVEGTDDATDHEGPEVGPEATTTPAHGQES